MSVKYILNNREVWEDFNRRLEEKRVKALESMSLQHDLYEIYRLQGEARALKKLINNFRDEVNNE